jgi:hypothetical protein
MTSPQADWHFQYLPCDHRVAIDVFNDGSTDHIIPTGEPLKECCRRELGKQFSDNFVLAMTKYAKQMPAGHISELWNDIRASMCKERLQ